MDATTSTTAREKRYTTREIAEMESLDSVKTVAAWAHAGRFRVSKHNKGWYRLPNNELRVTESGYQAFLRSRDAVVEPAANAEAVPAGR